MSNLERAIEELKLGRVGAWIYNSDGVIRGDVFVADTLEILEYWLDNNLEVDLPKGLTEEELYDIIEYNTYNWGSNISNDVAFGFYNNEIMIAMVHIRGDVRDNYTTLFALEIGNLEQLLDSLPYLEKDIDNTHIASFDFFNEGMSVYNTETEEEFDCYELELGDLLQEIKDKEGE